MISFGGFNKITGLLLAILIIGGDVWLWRVVAAMRIDVARTRATLVASPLRILELASLQAELARRQKDIARLQQYILSRDELDTFVNAVEQEGKHVKVAVVISAVKEKQRLDEQGQPVAPSGATEEVEFDITAAGAPEDLLEFLHKVESLPYLLYLESWNIMTGTTVASLGLTNSIPASPGGTAVVNPQDPSGHLEASIILSIAHHP